MWKKFIAGVLAILSLGLFGCSTQKNEQADIRISVKEFVRDTDLLHRAASGRDPLIDKYKGKKVELVGYIDRTLWKFNPVLVRLYCENAGYYNKAVIIAELQYPEMPKGEYDYYGKGNKITLLGEVDPVGLGRKFNSGSVHGVIFKNCIRVKKAETYVPEADIKLSLRELLDGVKGYDDVRGAERVVKKYKGKRILFDKSGENVTGWRLIIPSVSFTFRNEEDREKTGYTLYNCELGRISFGEGEATVHLIDVIPIE